MTSAVATATPVQHCGGSWENHRNQSIGTIGTPGSAISGCFRRPSWRAVFMGSVILPIHDFTMTSRVFLVILFYCIPRNLKGMVSFSTQFFSNGEMKQEPAELSVFCWRDQPCETFPFFGAMTSPSDSMVPKVVSVFETYHISVHFVLWMSLIFLLDPGCRPIGTLSQGEKWEGYCCHTSNMDRLDTIQEPFLGIWHTRCWTVGCTIWQ